MHILFGELKWHFLHLVETLDLKIEHNAYTKFWGACKQSLFWEMWNR